jgi:transcription initiation factor IIE alpha subunit
MRTRSSMEFWVLVAMYLNGGYTTVEDIANMFGFKKGTIRTTLNSLMKRQIVKSLKITDVIAMNKLGILNININIDTKSPKHIAKRIYIFTDKFEKIVDDNPHILRYASIVFNVFTTEGFIACLDKLKQSIKKEV